MHTHAEARRNFASRHQPFKLASPSSSCDGVSRRVRSAGDSLLSIKASAADLQPSAARLSRRTRPRQAAHARAMRRPAEQADARPSRAARADGAVRAHATAASVEAQLASTSLTPEPFEVEAPRGRRRSSAAASAMDADALMQPLVDELERMQLRIRELEREVAEERQRGRATERRLLTHVQALLDKRGAAADDAAGAFALPPAGHPFWRQPEAPATAIRMLEDAEAARARCAAQLDAAAEVRQSMAAQLDTLLAKNRALTSAALSLEMAGTARRARS